MATVSKAGSLQYRQPDGTIRTEVLTQDELFDEKWLDSIATATITSPHPPTKITPQNWRKYAVGMSGDRPIARVDRGLVEILFTVNDAEAIDAIESGRAREVSAGYDVEIHKDADGTLYQRNRRANHLAIVPKGRAGSTVRLHFDSDDDFAVMAEPEESGNNGTEVKPQVQIRTDGAKKMSQILVERRIYNVDGDDAHALSEAIAALQTKLDESATQITNLTSDLTAATARAAASNETVSRLEGEKTGLQTRLDDAEKSRMDDNAIAAEVQTRMDVWSQVLPALRKTTREFTPDWKLDSIDIKKLYLKQVAPHLSDRLDSAEASFVDGCWETLKPTHQRADHVDDMLRVINSSERVDGYGGEMGGGMRGKENPMTARRKNRGMPGMMPERAAK